jgi:SOS-response transcriptional repressor LexA
VDLKGLLHRELSEGVTEKELASLTGVSGRTIADILVDKLPQDPAIWENFARYFRIHADFLRAGGHPLPEGVFELTGTSHRCPIGSMRTVPLLKPHQINQMFESNEPPRVVQAETMLETDVTGKRTFAVMVKGNSMEPLFSEGEIVFVNPDLSSEPDDYVIVQSDEGHQEGAFLRQFKEIGGRAVLHPLNRRYEDLPLSPQHQIAGRVVRLRKNF